MSTTPSPSFLRGRPCEVTGGFAHGRTDDHGFEAVEGQVHVYDWHAIILHLLGFDPEKLAYRHAGREMRLTDVTGSVVKEIFAWPGEHPIRNLIPLGEVFLQ